MLKRLIHIALFLALATSASAQYLQGTLSGGPPAPGTKTRSPLNSLERAANNLPGVTIVTDTFGNQRFAYYVRVLDSCLNYDPLTYVGTMPPSCFVYQCGTQDSLFYIDWKGDAVFVGAGGACDEDWLQISDNTCPDAITDSIYHYKYAAVGARLVWPTAEFLVNDSTGVAVQILAGDRNARLGFWDNFNQVYSTIDQSGTSTIWYFNPTGEMRFVTAGGGTPQIPGAPFVNQFAIDPNDTPLPTVQAHLYPNTRTDTNTVENFIYTDPVGKFRSQPIDSLIQIVVDSISGDSTLQSNWYTTNGVTTSTGRTAYVKRTAQWIGLDTIGFLRHRVRPDNFNGSQSTVYNDSLILEYANDIPIVNRLWLSDTGVIISTTGDEARSVNVLTDTVNWSSSFDPTLQIHNLLADGTYFFADSLKVVAIGQFQDFPNFNLDGTEKGFFYDAPGEEVILTYGNGTTGDFSLVSLLSGESSFSTKVGGNESAISLNSNNSNNSISLSDSDAPFVLGTNRFEQISNDTLSNIAIGHNESVVANEQAAFIVMGIGGRNSAFYDKSEKRKFAIETHISDTEAFLWFEVDIPALADDTTGNEIAFYNGAYRWANLDPSSTVGDTSFHFWAGNGTDTDPGFMTLDEVCDHCAESAVNIYNSNGTTTDNTRIADVLKTITWRSDDAAVDGVFPFRFELDDETVNEPEMMVWKFPDDSLTLYQSDQEISFRSTNQLLLRADEQASVWADSLFYLNQGVGAFSITQYNQITQSSVSAGSKKEYIANRSITGTAQTELFLDGSSAVLTLPANSNNNFEIHVTAICSNAGNGVGISTGDSWGSWYFGDIKRISNTTTLVGIATPSAAQADASMSTSVVAIDANDTNDSLRIRFTPPSTAGSTTVIRVIATIELAQISY